MEEQFSEIGSSCERLSLLCSKIQLFAYLLVILFISVHFIWSNVHSEVQVSVHGYFKTHLPMTMSAAFMVSNQILLNVNLLVTYSYLLPAY